MLAVCGLAVGLDQAAKAAITESLERGERIDLVFGFELAHVTNRGLAFGLLDDGRGLVLGVTAVALALLVAWFASDPARPRLWLGVGLLIGGALGNLADRIRVDAVTDFLDPPLWPAFNLADVAITAGVAVIVLAAVAGGSEPQGEP
jgi:signal peptidase II